MTTNQTGKDGKEIALEPRDHVEGRLFSPSVARNRDPIREAFSRVMPDAGHILEVGSGTGEHAAHICGARPLLRWQPTDPDDASRQSIASWAQTVRSGQMAAPLDLRTDEETWWVRCPNPRPDGIVSINMIHIAPWAATLGLFAGAGELLSRGKRLFLYGPFKRNGTTAESNERFDADLKRRNADWGVRDLDLDLAPLAERHGLVLESVTDMPANNLTVVFERT